MPDDPATPPPPPPPPPPEPVRLPPLPGARAPVPGWMWALCVEVPVGLGVLQGTVSGLRYHNGPGAIERMATQGAIVGVIWALPLLGGLALSGRFFTSTAGRIFGGLMFAGLLLVGLGAVAFAGCLCLMSQNSGGHF